MALRPPKSAPTITTLDQIVSSVGNFAFVVFLARASGVAEFGRLALAYLTLQLVVGLARAVLGEPYLVGRFTAGADEQSIDESLIAATAWLGGSLALLGGIVAVVTGQPSGVALLIGAGMFPVLCQDMARFLAFGGRHPRIALVSDLGWTASFVAACLVWEAVGDPSPSAVVMIWLLGSALGLALTAWLLKVKPVRPRIRPWWVRMRDSSIAYGVEYVMLKVSVHAAAYVLAAVVSVEAVAGYRGASSITNIVTVFFASVPFALMPALRQRVTEEPPPTRAALLRAAAAVSGALVLLTAVLGSVLMILPDRWGRLILGASWAPAESLLLPMLLSTASIGATFGILMVLRATAQLRASVTARAVQSVIVFVFSIVGALLWDAQGAAYGLAIGSWLGLIWWVRALWTSSERFRLGEFDVARELPDQAAGLGTLN